MSRQDTPPELIIGLETADDAAVYVVAPGVAIVETVDFFAPIVDDPYAYGQIAAANAMSDVYAMGGEVLFALNVAAWPEDLDLAPLERIFEGGVDKIAEAGGAIVGGHTIVDREPKYGLAVTGRVDPDRLIRKSGAGAGDRLYLTKAIGTGLITTAHKRREVRAEDLASAVASMVRLNRAAAAAAVAAGVRGGTDVTGFGLIGHAYEMATASGVALRLESARVPLLPRALNYAERGMRSGGLSRNVEYFLDASRVRFETELSPALHDVLLDPQTSGGLLLAVSPSAASAFERECLDRAVTATVIGEVVAGSGVSIA
ncbi:MAG: selenide, water dikinase SelD [Chloroflexi bacterium 13_1_40CM_4_68_4]|nr:MAG: selenide, water dikinase SelD [Chloroflexi bacterium 13_1_40CM_4_68_4]